jgi:hypothetical protein
MRVEVGWWVAFPGTGADQKLSGQVVERVDGLARVWCASLMRVESVEERNISEVIHRSWRLDPAMPQAEPNV